MAYDTPYQKKNYSGSLFKNDNKQNNAQPDYRGDILIDGVEYWMSGWKQKGKSGTDYMSLALKKKDKAGNAPAASAPLVPSTPPTPVSNATQDGDLPF